MRQTLKLSITITALIGMALGLAAIAPAQTFFGGGGSFRLLSGTVDPIAVPPTVVQTTAISQGQALALMPLAFTSPVTAGNYSAVFVNCGEYPGGNHTPTDTRGTIYSLIARVSVPSYVSGSFYGGPITASGSNTVTVSGSCSFASFAIFEIRGTNGTTDAAGGTAPTNGSTTPTLTTLAGNDLILVGNAGNHSAMTFTATAPTILDQQSAQNGSSDAVAIGHITASGAAPYAANLVSNARSDSTVVMMALQPAPAPGSIGQNGDFYLNMTTGVLYGPKTAGAWSAKWKLTTYP